MHFVKTEDLCPGMRLAKPIYNRLGCLLYTSNLLLSLYPFQLTQKRLGLTHCQPAVQRQILLYIPLSSFFPLLFTTFPYSY